MKNENFDDASDMELIYLVADAYNVPLNVVVDRLSTLAYPEIRVQIAAE